MKNEIFRKFISTEVKPKLKTQLNQMELVLQTEKTNFTDCYFNGFDAACSNFNQNQSSLELKTAYIAFHPLRTRFQNRDFRYQVRMYDSNWYISDGVTAGDLDFGLYFRPYVRLWEELLEELKKYGGAIREYHVEQVMQSLIPIFHSRLADSLKAVSPALLKAAEYIKQNREERVCFYTGELMSKPELLLIDHNMRPDMFDVREKIEEKSSLAFEDLRQKRFENEDLGSMDFTYTDFREAEMTDTDFSGACFKGTRFQDSTLYRCKFLYSVLDSVNFDGCILKQNLFTGAVIKNTDFTKAKMDSCGLKDATLLNCRI